MIETFLDWMTGLPGPLVYAILTLLSALENIFPPVPADVAVVAGAFLSHRGVVDAPFLGVLCWLANTASSAGMYFYARAHGRRFLESGWPRRFMPPAAVASLEDAFARHGMLGVFVSRFLPAARAAVTPLAGVVGMPALRCLVPSATASAIWYALLVGLGSFLGFSLEAARATLDNLNRVLGAISVVAIGAFVFWLVRRSRASASR